MQEFEMPAQNWHDNINTSFRKCRYITRLKGTNKKSQWSQKMQNEFPTFDPLSRRGQLQCRTQESLSDLTSQFQILSAKQGTKS